MANSKDLHVIYGIGPAGAATARELVKAGKRVRMVNRSGKGNALTPKGVEFAAADVTDPAQARKAGEGASVIYNCLNAPYDKWPTLFPPLQAGLVAAVKDLRVPLVVLENVYMYGEVAGPMVETLPYHAHTKKGKVRAEMSRALSEAHERGEIRVTMGRASDFYGPGAESVFGERTFSGLVAGKGAEVVGNPDVLHTYSYLDDVGYGLATLGLNFETAVGQVWHLPSAPAQTPREMLKYAFDYLKMPEKINVMGKLMMMMGGLFIPAARESVEMMYEFEKPFVLDSSKFFRAFGERYTPVKDGMIATVKWYQQKAA